MRNAKLGTAAAAGDTQGSAHTSAKATGVLRR
jgi:hypothetical protein